MKIDGRAAGLGLGCIVIGLSALSCGGKGGEVVRPKDITGASALGVSACTGGSKLAKPYIVDISPSLRVELEAAMKRGVVVVSYDCQTLRVLPKCNVHASYEYAGVSMKQQVVEMTNQDELNVNVPLSAGKLGAELKGGNSISLALVMVGQRATTLERLDHGDVSGESCQGATHFITDAALGAFAMGQTSAGKASGSADLFGAISASGSSSSSRKAMSTDGSLDACKTSDPDAPKPPAQCQSAIALTLQPLAGVPKPAGSDGKNGPSGIVDPCPDGFLLSKGKCTRTPDGPKACAPKSPTCLDECNKGSAESCFNHAVYTAPKEQRAAFYKKACDGGMPDGCGWYVRQEWDGKGAKSGGNKELLVVAHKACADGGGAACTVAGDMLDAGETGPSANHKAGLKDHERGCALGDWMGCASAAAYYRAFEEENTARVMALYERACTGSADGDCSQLAKWLADPSTKVRDPEAAARAARMECAASPEMCEEMAALLHEQLKMDAEAFKLAKSGCDKSPLHCEQLGKFQWQGVGAPKDQAAAKASFQKACDAQMATNPKNVWPACASARDGYHR